MTLQAKQNLQAPWLGFTAFFTFAIMLSLLGFGVEGVRDAFDPRKSFVADGNVAVDDQIFSADADQAKTRTDGR
jgi:microcin C transport system permease protein